MEAVEQWIHKEVEELAEEVGLQGRRHRRHQSQTTTDSTMIETAPPNDVESSNSDDHGELESGIALDKDRGTSESIGEFSTSKDANLEISISENTILQAVSSLIPSNKLVDEQIENAAAAAAASSKERTGNGSTSLIKESRNDETELYLDKVYKKAVAHEFYCPNCKACIQKVIVRELESDSAPLLEQNDDTFKCSSCFSFLIPAENWFFSSFMPNGQGRRNKQAEPNLVQDPSRDYSYVGSIHDQTKLQPSKGVLPDENSHAPSMNVAASLAPAAVAAGVALTLGANQTEDIEKDNVAYPKPDSGKQEDEFDTGVSSVGAMGNVNTDYKHSQTAEHDGRLTIQPNDKKDVKDEESDKTVDTALPPSTSILIPDPEDGQTIPSEPRDDKKWEIIKSIVYGGLIESVTSLGVVTSAASADATILNTMVLALANLVGGLFIMGHNLRELKNEQPESNSNQTNEPVDRYQELLGKRQNFFLHATVAILSFLVFGLVPPVVYGFSFRKSDNMDYKLAAVAAASLLCITILAICKAYVRRPPKNYIETVLHYAVVGLMASGVSYLAGELIKKLIEKLGLFNSEVAVTMPRSEMSSGRPAAWASY
eukprot:XP_015583072.1 membrane protein of ER body-like protein isoform X2 [Ricinus communis]